MVQTGAKFKIVNIDDLHLTHFCCKSEFWVCPPYYSYTRGSRPRSNKNSPLRWDINCLSIPAISYIDKNKNLLKIDDTCWSLENCYGWFSLYN